MMKILVAIANYGTKNAKYLDRILAEYKSMPYDVSIVVLSNTLKNLGPDVEVVVGLPTKDPWSLPFGHKKIFADRVDDYDLFIYSEDDTLITTLNIESFLEVTEVLPDDKIAGFIRFEYLPTGRRRYPDVSAYFHWCPDSVKIVGCYTFAHFTNEHAACFMLTRGQLQKAIRTGGFMSGPRKGRYAMPETAATDPYTQCGMTKVICISHLRNFTLHHLPNAYIERFGCSEYDFDIQVNRLLEISRGEKSSDVLLRTEKPEPFLKWSKSYYESCSEEVVNIIPSNTRKVLSVGSGVGDIESTLVARGYEVTCIPLDSVVSACTELKGVRVSPANIDKAFEFLAHDRYDCILMYNVIHHFADPIAILSGVQNLLQKSGVVIITAPNYHYYPAWKNVAANKKIWGHPRNYDRYGLHFSTARYLKQWVKSSGLNVKILKYADRKKINILGVKFKVPFGFIAAENIIVTANKQRVRTY